MGLKSEDNAMFMERVFSKYIPLHFVPYLVDLYSSVNVSLIIKNPRKTKFGDFKPLKKTGWTQITINNNLNEYGFLITALHEFAHLLVYETYRNNVSPHGKEWKDAFKTLLIPVLESKKLPEDIQKPLLESISNIKSSTCYNYDLYKAIVSRDDLSNLCFLEKIENGGQFQFNGLTFVRGDIRRTRFICTELETKNSFLFHGLAKVKAL